MDRAEVPSMSREQRLSEWIEDYSDTILRTCYLYLSDHSQAEDATQDTWIKAWKHMDDFERKKIVNEKAWLLRIAINTCKDYRRTAWFRHIDRKQSLEELSPQLLSVEPKDETLTLLVMELPDRYKQVILLYYFQGLNMQETANALGSSQSSVQRRLKQCRSAFRWNQACNICCRFSGCRSEELHNISSCCSWRNTCFRRR